MVCCCCDVVSEINIKKSSSKHSIIQMRKLKALPCGAVDWSAVCDCGSPWSYNALTVKAYVADFGNNNMMS